MNIAVVFASGTGQRMHSKEKPKQFLTIHGIPIIVHTLRHFQNNENIDAIVVSCIGTWIDHLKESVKEYNLGKVKKIVPGGATGQLRFITVSAPRRSWLEQSVRSYSFMTACVP